jgi:hypothetical protein
MMDQNLLTDRRRLGSPAVSPSINNEDDRWQLNCFDVNPPRLG